MSTETISQRLAALATGSVGRTQIARLRDVLEQVEGAIAAGVPHASIRAGLKAKGLDMKASTFSSALTRLRNGRPTRGDRSSVRFRSALALADSAIRAAKARAAFDESDAAGD